MPIIIFIQAGSFKNNENKKFKDEQNDEDAKTES